MKTPLAFAFFIGFIGYSQDGSPDLGFGDNSYVVTDLGAGVEIVNDAIQLSNGMILVGGTYEDTENDNILIGYTDNGAIDTSFGANGYIFDPIQDNIIITKLKQQPSGNILVLKSRYSGIHVLEQRLPNGDLDVGFANNGTLELFMDAGSRAFLQNNEEGKILVASWIEVNNARYLSVKKFLANGELDTTFANGGILEYQVTVDDWARLYDFKLLPDDSIVMLFGTDMNGPKEYYVLHFLPDGTLNQNYGNQGQVQIPVESDSYFCTSCLGFNDNSILVSCSYYNFNTDFTFRQMSKVTPNGLLDTSFGGGTIEDGTGGLIQPNQRILAEDSYVDFEGGIAPHFYRRFNNGFIDTSFQFSTDLYELGNLYLLNLQSGKLLLVASSIWYNLDKYIILQQFHNSPLGIEEFQSAYLSISPNPSEAIFQLKLENGNLLGTNYSISDISGKLIQKGTIDQASYPLDLTGFESGMYFLNVNQQTYKLLKN